MGKASQGKWLVRVDLWVWLLGTAVYYLQHATSFWIGIIGIIKAIFWPALLIYQVFFLLKL